MRPGRDAAVKPRLNIVLVEIIHLFRSNTVLSVLSCDLLSAVGQ